MTAAAYNVTITSDSPTVNYLPYSDGDITGGWNMTCSGSDDKTYAPQTLCSGQALRRTSFLGANLTIEFHGTAAYLFGSATPSTYSVQIDGQDSSESLSNLPSGVLAKVENLSDGNHTISLQVIVSSPITFTQAIFTTKLGQQSRSEGVKFITEGTVSYIGSSCSNVQNRTMVPFTQNYDGSLATLNTNFTYTGSWIAGAPGKIGAAGDAVYARQSTPQTGAFVTFDIQNVSAFFIYGIVNIDLSMYIIDLTVDGKTISNRYNGSARWIDLEVVMYWAAGLDRDKTYSVKMINLGQGTTPWCVFSHIDLLDGGPTLSQIVDAPSITATPHKSSPPIAPLVGGIVSIKTLFFLALKQLIVVGLTLIAIFLLSWVLLRRRRRRLEALPFETKPEMYEQIEHPNAIHQSGIVVPYHTVYRNSGLNSITAPAPVVSIHPQAYDTPVIHHRTHEAAERPMQSDSRVEGEAKLVVLSPPVVSSGLSISESEVIATPPVNTAPATSGLARSSRVYQEEDAGALSVQESSIVRLPPDYKESWNINN